MSVKEYERAKQELTKRKVEELKKSPEFLKWFSENQKEQDEGNLRNQSDEKDSV